MISPLSPPADAEILGISGQALAIAIPIVAICLFVYIMIRRLQPLRLAASSESMDSLSDRLGRVVKYGLLQYKHPRYLLSGSLHIVLFGGFVLLIVDSISLVFLGIDDDFVFLGMGERAQAIYEPIKAVAVTLVFVAAVIAAIRRGVFRPERYAVPERFGKDRSAGAVGILGLIIALMLSSALFDGSVYAATGEGALAGTLSWMAGALLAGQTHAVLQQAHHGAYFVHELVFFFFLCILPLGKHFHVITALPNIFFMRLERGSLRRPNTVAAGGDLLAVSRTGVHVMEDFSWKSMLDFYSCVDCGRCSDHCPANAAGRPLSPRFISTRGREHLFATYPLLPASKSAGSKDALLLGNLYDADEIWSCTTCGACEEECPVTIEYIDKIVDLRRGCMDRGDIPDSIKKPLESIQRVGNAQGLPRAFRGDWAEDIKGQQKVKVLDGGNVSADTLYFVDSMSSCDERVNKLAKTTARVLDAMNVDFGILAAKETDSGHDVRRYGEELLFEELREQNTQGINNSSVKRIVTSDPHALNALKKDYDQIDHEVEHISEVLIRHLASGDIKLTASDEDKTTVYTYHDACYLGRHNEIYDAPREVIDSIPGVTRVEMEKARDRSFCCGGGGLSLYHSPPEERQMEQMRVEMARKAGATCIVTACPNCNVRLSDAIDAKGWRDEMQVIDVVELADRHMARPDSQ